MFKRRGIRTLPLLAVAGLVVSASACTPSKPSATSGGLSTGGLSTGGLSGGGSAGGLIGGATLPPLTVASPCPASHPVKVPTVAGYEQVYDVCATLPGTDSLIINRSSGVLRVQPQTGVLSLGVLDLPTDDVAVTVARDVIDTRPDLTGAVLVPEAAEAEIVSDGTWTVHVSLDTTGSSEAMLAKSFGQYAVDKATSLPAVSLANDLRSCVSSAQAVWNDSNNIGDSNAIDDGLSHALDGYDSCHSFLDGINTDAGDAAGAAADAEEESGLLKAAGEVGSNFWKNLLELSLQDSVEVLKIVH